MKKQLNNEIKTIINIFLMVLILLVGCKNSTLAEVIINNQSKQLPKANEFNMNIVTFQIILRWNLQSNYIAIPGSSNVYHIIENNNINDFSLSYEDMKKINDINKNKRYANW